MRTPIAAVLVLLASTVAPAASGRTDVVVLLNGDRLTAEIRQLERGRLEIKTDDAGTIDIDWDKVAAVTAARQFEVTTSDGRRFVGSLGGTTSRDVAIVALDGTIVALKMSEVTGIARIGASFWNRLDGAFDVGFNYTRSSGIAQTTVNSNTVFRQPAFALRLNGGATLTHRDGEDKEDDQSAIEFSYARYRGRRGFVSGGVRFESNESLGLVLRSQAGGLAGLRLVNTNRAQLEIGAGVFGNREQGLGTEPTTNAEGALAMRWSYYSYQHPKTNADVDVKYYPSLSSWGRQRLQANTAVKRELLKDFYVGVNGFYTLDTDPPNSDAARSDVGVTLSIGWTY